MGTRTSLFILAFVGCTSIVTAQTSSLENETPAIPAHYTLISFVDNGNQAVATVPAVVSIETPVSSTETTSADAKVPWADIILDGGDGISDAPDAGWVNTTSNVRID